MLWLDMLSISYGGCCCVSLSDNDTIDLILVRSPCHRGPVSQNASAGSPIWTHSHREVLQDASRRYLRARGRWVSDWAAVVRRSWRAAAKHFARAMLNTGGSWGAQRIRH